MDRGRQFLEPSGQVAHAIADARRGASRRRGHELHLHRQQRQGLAHVSPERKARLKKPPPADVRDSALAGEPITASGWLAARPSGTEGVCKLYAESFKSSAHLDTIVGAAQQIVATALSGN